MAGPDLQRQHTRATDGTARREHDATGPATQGPVPSGPNSAPTPTPPAPAAPTWQRDQETKEGGQSAMFH
jgi:hypothetical protein